MTQLEPVKPKTMDFSKKVRAFRLANELSQEELAGLLGVTGNYIHLLEKGTKVPKETLKMLFESLATSPIYRPIPDDESADTGATVATSKVVPHDRSGDIMRDVQITVPRYVPVLSLAQAGNILVAWENLPMHWAEKVPYDQADPKAFAIRVQGDSMEPHFHEGDRLIVSPAQELANGEIVVARFTNGDTVLKLYHESKGGREVMLSSFNPTYPPKTYKRSEFEAIVVVVERLQDVRMNRLRWSM